MTPKETIEFWAKHDGKTPMEYLRDELKSMQMMSPGVQPREYAYMAYLLDALEAEQAERCRLEKWIFDRSGQMENDGYNLEDVKQSIDRLDQEWREGKI